LPHRNFQLFLLHFHWICVKNIRFFHWGPTNITQKSFPEMSDESKIHTTPFLIHLFNRGKVYFASKGENTAFVCAKSDLQSARRTQEWRIRPGGVYCFANAELKSAKLSGRRE